ncbi:TPA: fimbrial protein [Yersinia enterocolitica]|nr:fimbrial protein [Yersinia enterocolitica]HDL7822239.1 fimbrial protein [Yersinia enterocolitica]HDL7830212.1 fimbrial protein [Yersinia enterocolitica]HDL7871068.1 fimbrial protein [Yersinia enterocolitica]HDL7884752.1 fimbrial protein [Yersinia enterocolitica]
MQRWCLYLFLTMLPCCKVFAVTIPEKLTINAEIALNTCALTLSPANINFQQVSVSQLENNATTPQIVNLDIDCSWPATGVSIKFSPVAGVSSNSANLMKTGISGVGLALSWKDNGSTDFYSMDFNKSFTPTVALSNGQESLGQIRLQPKIITGEPLQAGSTSTSLTVEVTYD